MPTRSFRLILLCCAFFAIAAAQLPASNTTFTTLPGFTATLPAGYFSNNFSTTPNASTSATTSVNATGGSPGYSYQITAPAGVGVFPDSGFKAVGNWNPAENLTISFTSGNVFSSGANVWLSDVNGNRLSGNVTVNFSNGFTMTVPSTANGTLGFAGLTTTDGPLASMTILAAPGGSAFTNITNLTVADLDLYWVGSNGSIWTSGNNWSSHISGTPAVDFASNVDVIFSATGSTNQTNTRLDGQRTIASLTINSTGPVGITRDGLTINATSAQAITVLSGALSLNATLALTGNATTITANQPTSIYSINATKGLVTNGTSTTTILQRVWVSELGGSLDVQSGTFHLADALSSGVGTSNETITTAGTINATNTINVGYDGDNNTLAISPGGTVLAPAIWIGGLAGADKNTITVNGTGSSLVSTSSTAVGYAGSNNTLVISNGATSGGTSAALYIGLESTANNNTATVTGANSTWSTTGALIIGNNGTANTLAVQNGGQVLTTNADLSIGFNAGSNNNTLTINGTGSLVTNNGTLHIGHSGSSNAIAISNGGNLTTRNSRVGTEAASANNSANVTGAGSVWNNTGTLRVGSNGTASSLTVADGALLHTGGDMFLGYSAVSANNLLTVNGTGSKLLGANLTVGYGGSSNNLLVQNGANLTLTQGLGIGYEATSANNTATITGTGSTLTAQNIQIGDGANNKLLIADTATVSTGYIALAGTNATLQIGNGAAAGNITTTGSILTIGNSTGRSVVFNHADVAYQFASSISGNLAVSQLGAGKTILTANNTHTGGTTISAGTLQIGNGGTTGSITGNITNNAALAFNHSNNSTYSELITGTGTLEKLGTGTLTISGENSYIGGTTISAGTLQLGNGGTTGSVSGAIINNSTLAINRSDDVVFSNTLSGTGSILKLGNNTLTYNSTNTALQGGTTINAGTLLVTGSTSAVTINNSGILAGTGTIGAVVINSGGAIAPGSSPGTLNTGNMTWNGGGIYNWELASVNGTAGTGWDLISSAGSLTIGAGANNTFTISLLTYGNATLAGLKKASWEIGNFTTGITGFNKNAFSFNATNMAGNDGRYFLSTNGSSLLLNYKTAATWNTGSGLWSTASRWQDESLPENGDEIEFTGVGGTSTNNNYINSVSGIVFMSGAGAYTLNGSALAIGEDGIVNNSANTQTVATNLTAGEILSLNAVDGDLIVSGVVSGGSALSKLGSMTATLAGTNTYTGGTTISAGTLALGGTQGSVVGNITVGSGATFAVNRTNNVTISNPISGSGAFAQVGTGVTSILGNNTYTGGTSITSGTLWTRSSGALGNGTTTLGLPPFTVTSFSVLPPPPPANGTLLVSSTQEMGGNLLIGGDLDWYDGTIAFYDTGTSPALGDLTINVGGSFFVSTSTGNATFDFSGVEALDAGVYTLVNATSILAGGTNFVAAHGQYTKLFGNFTTTNKTVVYSVTGAESGGPNIWNNGGPNTPVIANYNVDIPTITIGTNNTVSALTFGNNGSLTINATGQLVVTSGNLAVTTGTSIVSGGNLTVPGAFTKTGTGELDVQSNTNVTGIANVVEGLLSVNGNFTATQMQVGANSTLGGTGRIIAPGGMTIAGTFSPGNSPGVISVQANPVFLTTSNTLIEIVSPTVFDQISVVGTATLDGTLTAQAFGGGTITLGNQYEILSATGGITGNFTSIEEPDGYRGRFINLGTVGILLFGPESFVPYALNQNQRNVAAALDTFVLATSGDALPVGIALDSLQPAQYPAAFDQIMPGFYESLGDMAIEQAYTNTQLLTQRLGSVRLGAAGFQAIGMSQPLKYDIDGDSVAEASTLDFVSAARGENGIWTPARIGKLAGPSPSQTAPSAPLGSNWSSWVMGIGEFSMSRGLSGVPNYNNNAGGFLAGADYRFGPSLSAGLYAGYQYNYAKYNTGSSTQGNSALFGLYASYANESGWYADTVIGGGYTGFQTRRSIEFSTIDRTASANPNSGQFSAAINLGKDFEVSNFVFGPIIGAQYTYVGIGGFTETGADSLDLAIGQQNANSFRTNLGARLAYNWEVGSGIVLTPELRGYWMHEFLDGPRNIASSLNGGAGPSFAYETETPYSNSLFGGAGVSAKFGERWNGSLFYNVNYGGPNYTNNIISGSLGFSF